MNILSKLFRNAPVEPQIKVQIVGSNTLTLMQWRKQEKLVTDAMVLARNPTFQMMLDVLKNEHPARNGFPSVGTRAEDRAAHQAKCEGFEACLNSIKEFSQPWAMSKPLVARFEPPQETTNRK